MVKRGTACVYLSLRKWGGNNAGVKKEGWFFLVLVQEMRNFSSCALQPNRKLALLPHSREYLSTRTSIGKNILKSREKNTNNTSHLCIFIGIKFHHGIGMLLRFQRMSWESERMIESRLWCCDDCRNTGSPCVVGDLCIFGVRVVMRYTSIICWEDLGYSFLACVYYYSAIEMIPFYSLWCRIG